MHSMWFCSFPCYSSTLMLRLCACILWICTGFHTHREVQGTPQTQNISSSMITMNDSIYTKILWNSGIWHLHVMYKQPGHTNNSPQKLSPWRRELLGTRNRNRLRSPKYPLPASDKYPALAASHFASLQNLAIKSLRAILSHLLSHFELPMIQKSSFANTEHRRPVFLCPTAW